MWFQVCDSPEGYVVEAYWVEGEYGTWKPLRNFGQRQGDAKDFCHLDCPQLTEQKVKVLISRYNPTTLYERRRFKQYIIQKH